MSGLSRRYQVRSPAAAITPDGCRQESDVGTERPATDPRGGAAQPRHGPHERRVRQEADAQDDLRKGHPGHRQREAEDAEDAERRGRPGPLRPGDNRQ